MSVHTGHLLLLTLSGYSEQQASWAWARRAILLPKDPKENNASQTVLHNHLERLFKHRFHTQPSVSDAVGSKGKLRIFTSNKSPGGANAAVPTLRSTGTEVSHWQRPSN